MKKFRPLFKLITASTMLLVLAEISARLALGLGDPLLYEVSPTYGYRPQPNQNLRRLGNRIYYNDRGLRSEPITDSPKPGTIRVLCIGDSITFGGVQVDQADTYPYQLQKILRDRSSKDFEVLNASAGGWGIENEEAYLSSKGIYHSQIVVLQLGSHDLFQPKSSGEIVGRSLNFPDRKPLLALQEGVFRYFIPRFLPGLQPSEPNLKSTPTKQDLNRNINSFTRIAELVKAKQAKLIVILIEQPEALEPKNELTAFSKQTIANKSRQLGVVYKNLGESFRSNGDKRLFRDIIHPNSAGNQVMAKNVAQLITNNFNESNRQLSKSETRTK